MENQIYYQNQNITNNSSANANDQNDQNNSKIKKKEKEEAKTNKKEDHIDVKLAVNLIFPNQL